MKLHHFLCVSAATLVLSSVVATAAPARRVVARGVAAYDGAWSVLIVTDRGSCDRAYRYSVNIRGGVVGYGGASGFDLYGRVVPGGAVRVTVAAAGQRADGVGRLSGAGYGSGVWRGHGATTECSGRWSAQRQ